MTFSIHPGRGSHARPSLVTFSYFESVNTHAITKHRPLAQIFDTCALIFSSSSFSQFTPTAYHVAASHPSPGDNHQRTWGRSERTRGQAKMAGWNSICFICTRALHSFISFAHCRLSSTVIPRFPRPPSHHPSSLTSVSLVPALHLLPPSTPFWQYGTHPFFHMPKPSRCPVVLQGNFPCTVHL